MKALTKRQWTSWLRWSLLAFVIHAVILGLLYGWNLFSFYERDIILFKDVYTYWWGLPQAWCFESFYPRIFEALMIPIFSLFSLFAFNKAKDNKDKEDSIYASITGFIFGVALGLFFELKFGLVSGLVFGLICGIIFVLFYYRLVFGLIFAISFGLISAISFGLAFGLVSVFALELIFLITLVFKFLFSSKTLELIFDWFMAKKIEN